MIAVGLTKDPSYMMESFHLSPGVVALDAVRSPARRSISIFSRRGTDTPEQPVRQLSQSISMCPTKTDSRPPGGWKRRLSRLNKRGEEEIILHAVPPAFSDPPMTPMEQVMATSPNEEILCAIGKGYTSDTSTAAAPFPDSEEWNTSPRAKYCPQTNLRRNDSKIGVWRDGVAHWDPLPKRTNSVDITTNQKPFLLNHRLLDNSSRPNLSVVIPNAELGLPMGPQPWTKRYSLPVIPTSVAKSHISSSPVSYSGSEIAIHPAFRSNKDFLERRSSSESSRSHQREVSIASLNASRSSTTSSTIPEEASDKGSVYSRNSSMTSVEEEQGEGEVESLGIFQDLDWSCGQVPKEPVTSFTITSPAEAGVFDDQSPVPTQRQEAPPSPTLSAMFQDLHTQLGTISEDCITDEHDQVQSKIPQAVQPPTIDLTRTPTIPKKSRKRQWRASSLATNIPSQIPSQPTDLLVRRLSAPSVAEILERQDYITRSGDVPRSNSVRVKHSVNGDTPESEMSLESTQISLLLSAITSLAPATEVQSVPKASKTSSASDARAVLFRILSSLCSIEDLQATSMINKGMRQVYKDHELHLFRTVLENKSPAAWELREWSPVPFTDLDSGVMSPSCDHSPSTYLYGTRKDEAVIRELKILILQRCQSFLRNETVAALLSDDDANSQRFDDAFYRLWCFCRIFGCEKGREDDVTGQLDWLRGGLLAHQQDCAATVNINLEFDMGGVLLNAPDHFAMGNKGGLSASQLYDVTEIWNCLASLLAGYHGRTGQARHYGIYDDVAVPPGEIEGEEAVLEEWMSYILTLGPSVVLELAQFSEDNSEAGFKVAKLNGWTEWTLSSSGNSRCTFFREPVARLYEERIAMASMHGNSAAKEKKEMSRKRVASMAAEIKLARSSSNYQRLPLIDMASERAMSVMSRRDSGATSHPPASPPSHYGAWSPRRVSPIIEDRVEGYNRLSLLSLEGIAEDTSARAIAKIVAMGFSDAQAKEALKLTDLGNGLRVDRAVDFLLRQH